MLFIDAQPALKANICLLCNATSRLGAIFHA